MNYPFPSIHSQQFQDDLFDYYYNQPGTMPGTIKIDSTAKGSEIVLIDYDANQATRLSNLTPL